MKLPLRRRHLSILVGAGVFLLSGLLLARVLAEDKTPKPPAPPAAEKKPKLDYSKFVVERPIKGVLAKQTDAAIKSAGDKFVNPKVQPGKVRWHDDFAAACRAAEKSGKPVLLFQMMGKLDEQFC